MYMTTSTKFIATIVALGTLAFTNLPGNAQVFSASMKAQKKPVTKIISKSLKTILKNIESEFKVSIMADNELLDGKTSNYVNYTTLEETLNSVTSPHNLTFEKIGKKQYVIFAKKNELNSINPVLQINYSVNNSLDANQIANKVEASAIVLVEEIKGRVVASDGEPLPGANIVLQGSGNVGTTTDDKGNFKLTVAKKQGTLTFSFIGYLSQNVEIDGRDIINVTLSIDSKNLDEVVLVGYGTQKRSSLTGAVSGVKGEELKNLPAQNIGTLLQGRVPGMFVSNTDGNPNSGSKIVIRGPVSINGGDPLFVIDGIPFQGAGFNFNSQDIENIEVLKDAAAASIYGAQAAAGVILVTTKKGKSGKVNISFNNTFGVRNAMNIPKTLRRDDYLKAKEAFGFDVVDLYGPKTGWSGLPNTDWFDEMFRQGTEQTYNLSLSGGSEKSTFFISGNYSNIIGTRKGNGIEKYNLRINTDHKLNNWIKFGQTLFIRNTIEDPDNASNQGGLAFRNTPIMNVYDPTNPIGGWGKSPRGFQGGNDVQAVLGISSNNRSWENTLSGYLDFNIAKGLVFRTLVGATFENYDNYSYQPAADLGNVFVVEQFSKRTGRHQKLISTFTLNYGKTIGKHEFKALGGYEARKEDNTNMDYSNNNPLVPFPQNSRLVKNQGNAVSNFEQGDIGNRILSQFGRIEYAYADKYLLTANIRRDGIATKFGPNNRFGVFPGISAGWKLSEESFMRELTFISTMKLRASYGVLGNSNIPDFFFTSAYEQGYAADVGINGVRQTSIGIATRLANPDIQWEQVATSNIGLDASLFNNRINVNIDYYNRETTKMLYGLAIAPSAGLGNEVKANIGQMNNSGLELNIVYRNKIKDLSYSIGVNGAFNKNTLTSLNPELGRQFLTNGQVRVEHYENRTASRSEPGQPLGQFFGYEVDGIYQTNVAAGETRPTISAKDNYIPKAGDLIYRDLNNDGKINDDDRKYIGNPWPKFTYGISLNAAYKSFDLRAFFSGVHGNDIYNAFESFEHSFFSDYTSTDKIFEVSGFNGNGVTNKPRIGKVDDLDNNGNWSNISSYHVQSGSYLRLKNIQFGYTLPASITHTLKIRNARVFFMADNLLTFTKYKGVNPELSVDNFLELGIDVANQRYPMSKLVSFGLNLDF